MKIAFEINHPSQVHLLKNLMWELERKGHVIKIVARDKEMTFKLLEFYKFNYDKIGINTSNIAGKAIEMVRTDMRLFRLFRNFRPDFLISSSSPYSAHTSAILGKPYIVFSDTEHTSKLGRILTFPFTCEGFSRWFYGCNPGKGRCG